MFISKGFLKPKLGDDVCQKLDDIQNTLNVSHDALNLVVEKQLSNETLLDLQTNNADLDSTIYCVKNGQIKLDNDTQANVKSRIAETEKTGDEASNTIDNLVNPPTQPPPEDLSGFKSATIALGVLFSLALIAVVALAIYTQR